MKKVLIAILGLLTLAAASSFATQTRTTVMGDNNMIMVDDANMFMFPGRVNNYPNLALGEFGDGDHFYNFGITWQFNDENPQVLGTFVSYMPTYGPYSLFGDNLARFPYYYYYMGPSYAALSPTSPEELSNYSHPRRMQLLYGRKLGGNNFGVNLEAVKSSWEAKEDSGDVLDYDFNPKQSFHEYTLGLGLTEGTSGKWDLGISVMFGGWTNENPDGDKITEPDGYMDLMLNGRYFWVRNPKITLVPHATFGISKRGAKFLDILRDADVTTNDDAKTKYSGTMFDLGMGMNYTPAPNMLAVVDFGFMYETMKADHSIADTTIIVEGASYPNGYGSSYTYWDGEEKGSHFVVPYMKIGFEGEVFSWMDIRAGGYTTLWSNKDKWESDFDVDETWNTAWIDTYFGFGFNWGNLYLDTYTDPEMLLKGFNFISGNGYDEDGYNMNWQVSMVYEMF